MFYWSRKVKSIKRSSSLNTPNEYSFYLNIFFLSMLTKYTYVWDSLIFIQLRPIGINFEELTYDNVGSSSFTLKLLLSLVQLLR